MSDLKEWEIQSQKADQEVQDRIMAGLKDGSIPDREYTDEEWTKMSDWGGVSLEEAERMENLLSKSLAENALDAASACLQDGIPVDKKGLLYVIKDCVRYNIPIPAFIESYLIDEKKYAQEPDGEKIKKPVVQCKKQKPVSLPDPYAKPRSAKSEFLPILVWDLWNGGVLFESGELTGKSKKEKIKEIADCLRVGVSTVEKIIYKAASQEKE